MTDKISPLHPERKDIIYDGYDGPTLYVFKALYEGKIPVAVKVVIRNTAECKTSLRFRELDKRMKSLSNPKKLVFCNNAGMKTLCGTSCQIRTRHQVYQLWILLWNYVMVL